MLLAAVLCLTLWPMPCAAADSGAYIIIDDVPSIDGGSYVTGHVVLGSGQYTDYRVTMALSVTRDGAVWAPKPTYDTPYVGIDSDGTFECRFVSGGNDFIAEVLYVYLVPSYFSPSADVKLTQTVAVDGATIYRSDGGNDVQYDKPRPESATRAATVAYQPKDVAAIPKLSICYSPYTNGLSPETNSAVPLEQMLWQLNGLYPYADTVRLFGVTGELAKIYKPLKDTYQMRVIGGCWIDKRYSRTQIYTELDKLIELTKAGYIDVAVVGSECLYRGDFAVDTLIEYINYVRKGVEGTDVPVTTSDTMSAFVDNPKLVDACDVILYTIYPFFEGTEANAAAQAVLSSYTRMKEIAKGKPVIISETGWPTAGSAEGNAVPGMDQAKAYTETLYNWSRKHNVEVIFFSHMDELWKVEGSGNDVGIHWGHSTADGMIKPAYQNLYASIAPLPVRDLSSAEWAKNDVTALLREGKVAPNAPGMFNPNEPVARGEIMHYLFAPLLRDGDAQPSTFLDVSETMYYTYSIGAAQRAGLVTGVGGNQCAAGQHITRQEFFTLIHRMMIYAGIDLPYDETVVDGYDDASEIDAYARVPLSALIEANIVRGDNNKLRPKGNVTRAEAAALINRVYEYMKK